MRGVQFNLNIPILICYVLPIVVIILDIRYGNVTECDKLMDKPIGFVHMDNQKVIFTANTFVVCQEREKHLLERSLVETSEVV